MSTLEKKLDALIAQQDHIQPEDVTLEHIREQRAHTLPVPPAPTATRQDIFSLDEGPVTIQWPASLSKESFNDLAAWMDILKRKIGRSVIVHGQDHENE
jgi:hypothetical protein